MTKYLLLGTVLGLSAGFAPGPLLTLVISETLQHNIKSGIKVALAPIITDLPIILLTLFVLSKLANFHNVLGIISIAGGFFILYTGYQSLHTKGMMPETQSIKSNSISKGVLTNILSPHPYIFWFSVGAPIMSKAISENMFALLTFIISFYTFLVGSKIVLAIATGKLKSFLSGNVYLYTLRFLGLLLCLLACVLFYDGMTLLAII